MANNFFITVPSNCKNPVRENKTNDFTIYLSTPLELTGIWQCGISEIIYPQSWYNIEREFGKITFFTNMPGSQHVEKCLPSGYYDSEEKLVDEMNQLVPKFLKQWAGYSNQDMNVFKLGKNSKKMRFYLNNIRGINGIQFHPQLARLLGFVENEFSHGEDEIYEHKLVRGKYPIDLTAGIQSLYIYSDVVEDSIIGDGKYPLLRIVDVETTNQRRTVTRQYSFPQYKQLRSHFIQQISIKINTDSGQPCKFQTGKSVITLHFKQESIES